ncbi:MAG TPA: glycosyltransferase family 1 protein, partial [Myxococcota bacterium]
MNVLLWHVHGSWTTAFVQGGHRYFVPVDEERGPFGRGRARTWSWPASVVEVELGRTRARDFDVVLLQRPE